MAARMKEGRTGNRTRGRMGALFGVELRRALGRNPWFWTSLGVGVALALWAVWANWSAWGANQLRLAVESWDVKEFGYGGFSPFSQWMPIHCQDGAAGAFFSVWPILAALPYAWAWVSDAKTGVLAQQRTRATQDQVAGAKLLATAVSGALAVCVPLVANFLALACLYPIDPAFPNQVMEVGVWNGMPLAGLFYTCPVAFLVLWTLFDAVVGALWAVLVCALSALVADFLESVVLSYLVLQLLAYVGQQLYGVIGAMAADGSLQGVAREVQSGLDLLHLTQLNIVSWPTLALDVALLAVAAASLACVLRGRDVL